MKTVIKNQKISQEKFLESTTVSNIENMNKRLRDMEGSMKSQVSVKWEFLKNKIKKIDERQCFRK